MRSLKDKLRDQELAEKKAREAEKKAQLKKRVKTGRKVKSNKKK